MSKFYCDGWNNTYRYQLIATNEQGATISLYENTKKAVLSEFDAEYSRRGYKIRIIDNRRGPFWGEHHIKVSFR